MRTRYKLAILGVPLLPSLMLLVQLGLSHETATRGSSAEFWEYACAVQLNDFHGHRKYSYWGGIYPPVDGAVYYYTQDHHRQFLYHVPAYELARDLPEVRSALRQDVNKCPSGDPELCKFYEEGSPRRLMCRDLLAEPGAERPIIRVVSELQKAHVQLGVFGAIDPRREQTIRARLAQGRRAWLSFLFEGLFITGWILFTAWPWVRNRPVNRFVVHFTLSPFLLFLPYFLRYAPMTFTFGPSGGFVYPMYLVLASVPIGVLPCTRLDGVLWNILPPLLAPLAQVPGPPAAASYFRCVGPFSSLAFGAIMGGVLLLAERTG